MKKNYLKIIAVVLFCWIAADAGAQQLAVGLKGGVARTSVDRTNLGRIDETYSACNGVDFGFQFKYDFTDWFALRADLDFMDRTYRMDRNLHYIDPVYTVYRNTYVMLPVMADFSFGGEKLRGHLLGGGYIGYWMMAHNSGTTYWMTDYYVYFNDFHNEKHEFNKEDRRFSAGLVGGIGLSYEFNEIVGINFDAVYYYDLVSHHKGYEHLSDPRYLNTMAFTIGFYSRIVPLKNLKK